jgi:hypothetical protein
MKWLAGIISVAIVAVGVSVGPFQAQADDDDECKGGKCPLMDWMNANMQAAYDKEDLKALEKHLNTAAGYAPDPSWNKGDNGWEKIAKGAAAKAKAGDFKGVRTSCKTCHKAWRKKYRAEHRSKKLPK